MEGAQRPLELILARNFLTSVTTPALLVDDEGTMVFYNEAAAALLGRSFEESGQMRADEWLHAFGPVGDDDAPLELERINLAATLKTGRPATGELRIRTAVDGYRSIEAAAFPIVAGRDQASGAIIMFWTRTENGST
jgi:PAS domain-containing protein